MDKDNMNNKIKEIKVIKERCYFCNKKLIEFL